MQRVVLLCIGSLKESWTKAGAQQYIDRLRDIRLEVVELAPSKQKDSEKQRSEESERLIAAAKKYDGKIVVLDEKGEHVTSQQFASQLQTSRDRGETTVFILGGSYGLNDDVRVAAPSIRLSDMVLPHELCRVFLVEQLYRAQEIMKGSGYHH